jgi:hypothetical protein
VNRGGRLPGRAFVQCKKQQERTICSSAPAASRMRFTADYRLNPADADASHRRRRRPGRSWPKTAEPGSGVGNNTTPEKAESPLAVAGPVNDPNVPVPEAHCRSGCHGGRQQAVLARPTTIARFVVSSAIMPVSGQNGWRSARRSPAAMNLIAMLLGTNGAPNQRSLPPGRPSRLNRVPAMIGREQLDR